MGQTGVELEFLLQGHQEHRVVDAIVYRSDKTRFSNLHSMECDLAHERDLATSKPAARSGFFEGELHSVDAKLQVCAAQHFKQVMLESEGSSFFSMPSHVFHANSTTITEAIAASYDIPFSLVIDDVGACSRSDSLDPGSRSGTLRLAQVGGGDQKLDAVDDVVSFRPSCGVRASEDVFFLGTHLNPTMRKILHDPHVAKLDSLQVCCHLR
jgi:hypothetical protein